MIVFLIKSVSCDIGDSHVTLAGLSFPQGVSMVTLHWCSAFSVSKAQGRLKEAFLLSSLIVKLFNGSFVHATFIDQMTSRGELA